jgi:hypothetical protein
VKNYNCLTCQEPMKVSIYFHTFIRQHGPQQQRCMRCGAVHDVDEKNNIRLRSPGVQIARLSEEFAYPEYPPTRVGAYRVRYSNGQWGKTYANWNGEMFHNGPVMFREGSIISWQGLAGDMEYLKKMPYDIADPLPDMGSDDE